MIRRLSWTFLALLGVAACFIAYTSLNFGTVTNIGSAVYPLILSALIAAISVYVLVVGDREAPKAIDVRGFAGVVASVVVFIAMIEHFGLIPTVIASMIVAYAGQTKGGYGFFTVYASLFAAGTWLLFSFALGLPLPAFELP